MRIKHAQRFEYVLVRKFSQGLAADPFYYHTEKEISGIAVQALFAGCEVKLFLARQKVDNLRLGNKIGKIRCAVFFISVPFYLREFCQKF